MISKKELFLFWVLVWFILAMLLSSCGRSTSLQPALSATTASSAGIVHSTPVPTLIPSATPTYSAPTPILVTVTSTHLAPIATESYQQAYLDPDGWFSVNLPAVWKAKNTNMFSGKDGFFETGYLPEMMYMRRALNACQWLANINTNSVYGVGLEPTLFLNHHASACTLNTMPDVTPATVQVIIENPHMKAEKRFFYIKTDAEHFDEIIKTFAWLRSVNIEQEPTFKSMPLRSEDASFWKNTVPISSGFSIREYVLPPEMRNGSPSEIEFSRFWPAEVPTIESKTGNSAGANKKISVDEQLKAYGYEERTDPIGKTSLQLYKNGNLLFDNIYPIERGVYTFSTPTKPIIAFVVVTGDYKCHFIQNDKIIELGGCFNDPRFAPILYKGEFLWARAADYAHVQVETSKRDVIFSFATYFGVNLPVHRFQSWHDHWTLEIDDFLIQDGKILNERFGFEEAFDWQIVNDKPFYFFRKGPQVGISYKGEFLRLDYEEVAHGLCCGLTPNNPSWIDEDTVRFFGKRNGIWYYVIADVK
jgi:hypothetical protein